MSVNVRFETDPAFWARFQALAAEGKHARQIAAAMGIHKDTTYRLAQRNGIALAAAPPSRLPIRPCARCGDHGGASRLGMPKRYAGAPHGVRGRICQQCYRELTGETKGRLGRNRIESDPSVAAARLGVSDAAVGRAAKRMGLRLGGKASDDMPPRRVRLRALALRRLAGTLPAPDAPAPAPRPLAALVDAWRADTGHGRRWLVPWKRTAREASR